MKYRTCKTCGRPVASNAQVCLGCGTPIQQWRMLYVALAVLMLVLIVGILMVE